ncbi:MAG TPA: hypothetical protein VHJ39_07425 [Solirubrobacteraceae bacterium]|jgi:hypothetical protein|nr:hypothetical protein [Solirubrobacteraceae bacterium]
MTATGAARVQGELRGACARRNVEALAPSRTPGGGYRLRYEWHYLITTA